MKHILTKYTSDLCKQNIDYIKIYNMRLFILEMFV